MQMERFGADKILNTERGTYTDKDIYTLISKDEERTEAVNTKIKTNDKYRYCNMPLYKIVWVVGLVWFAAIPVNIRKTEIVISS